MSVKQLVEAAHNENAAEFEKIFESVINDKIADALAQFKRQIVAEQFGMDCKDDDSGEEDDDDKMKSGKEED